MAASRPRDQRLQRDKWRLLPCKQPIAVNMIEKCGRVHLSGSTWVVHKGVVHSLGCGVPQQNTDSRTGLK
jgi:hypothetical protein